MTRFIYLLSVIAVCGNLHAQNLFELTDEKVDSGAIFRTYNLSFEYDRDKLLPGSMVTIDSIAQFLHDHPNLIVEVMVHTASDVDNVYSRCLSCNRAKRIVDLLKERGIDPQRLFGKGYGDSVPLVEVPYKTGTKDDVKLAYSINRRVEIKIIKVQ